MSLSNLTEVFKKQAADNSGNITINEKTFTDAGLMSPVDLDVLLTKGYSLEEGVSLLIDTSYTTIPDPVEDILTISNGNTAILNVDKPNTSVLLTITATGNNIQISIVISLKDWSFSTSWQYMTGGVFDSLPYSTPAFIFSSEDTDGFVWEKEAITLKAGQNFASLITLTGILKPVIEFLSSWVASTKLTFVGSLDPSKVDNEQYIYPEMDLFVPINVAPISLLFLDVSSPALGFSIESFIDTAEGDEEESVVQTPFLFFQLQLNAGSGVELDFRTNINTNGSLFNISATPPENVTITPLNLFSLMAGKNWYDKVPSTLQQYINKIKFEGFQTSLIIEDKIPTIHSVSASAGSTSPWTLFANFEIEEFDVVWVVMQPLDTAKVSQTLYFSATVNFFPTIFVGGFDVEITSDLTLSAAFDGNVNINNLIAAVTNNVIAVPKSLAEINLTGFGIDMDINQKYYSFFSNGDVSFNIITNISLTNASMTMTSSTANDGSDKSVYTANISGLFTISILQLQTEVNYSSVDDGGWDLSLVMPSNKSLNIKELMDDLFGEVDFNLIKVFIPDNLVISAFSLSSNIPNGDKSGSYKVKTSVDWKFTFPFIEQNVDISANLAIEMKAGETPDKDVFSAGISGTFKLEPFGAEVNLGYSFDDTGKKEMYIEWEGFTAKYATDGESSTITFEIANWSVGSLVESFMKMLGQPNFELVSPWNVLNEISLNGFKVTYNLETKEIIVEYKLPKTLDLIFIKIESLILKRVNKKVQISFDGSSLVPSINDSSLFDKENGQDVNDMPSVPGQGSEYFDLRLLAMGQHVTINGFEDFKSIQEATDAMKKAFTEPEPGTIPITPDGLISFNENSNWLFAADFGILNTGTKDSPEWTVDLQAVFNDPSLYGIKIAMAGVKAKVFAGLEFEIMYKKISDSVGVYQMALTLPDSLRYLQFGAVSVTLPNIGVEIYTNGDFMIDIGFPYDLDFSRSFSLYAIVPPGIPAMGSGGFYFGKLSGATSTSVPQTNYGNFNPVLAFGLGMQVGVGYDIQYGVLKAGFSITVFGIIEGIIATYHPYTGVVDQSNTTVVETSYYYFLQGTFGIIGKLYGSLDFGIISADVNITVKVYAQATFEAYNKIPLAIVASVDVRVTAKLNLGLFSIKIHFSFNADIRTDLTIGTDDTALAPWNHDLSAAANVSTFSMTSPRMAIPTTREVNFNTKLITTQTETAPTLNIYLIPHLTISGAESNNLNTQTAQYVTNLWIDSPNPENPNELSSFETLNKDFFRWLVQSYMNEPGGESTRSEADTFAISLIELDAIYLKLSDPDTPFPIALEDLMAFLQNTFETINIQSEPPVGGLETAAIFPMFYDFELSVPKSGTGVDRNFSTYNMATDEYLKEVKEWFAQLAVKVSDDTSTNSTARSVTPVEHSLSTFVFEDYFVLIGKQLIGYAQDALKNYTYSLSSGNSLLAMVTWANSISVGTTKNEANSGSIAKANQSLALNKGLAITISGINYTIIDNDNFESIARVYAMNTGVLIIQNATTPSILVVGQTITYDTTEYIVKTNDTINLVVAGLVEAGAAVTLNELANNIVFQTTSILTVNENLSIVAAKYTAKSEDTFTSIATVTYEGIDVSNVLIQNQLTPGIFIVGNSFVYFGETYVILSGDTLQSIAVSLSETTNSVVSVSDLANDTEVQSLKVQPLAVVLIQPFIHKTSDNTDTFGAIAQKYSTTAEILGTNYENQILSDLFYDPENTNTANIPDLNCIDVAAVLNYFTSKDSYTQLAGMASRYSLYGMRLPTSLPGLTLNTDSPCVVTPQVDDSETNYSDCALYRLTGQQFEVPSDVAVEFNINLINNTLDWIEFNGKLPSVGESDDDKTATLSIVLVEDDIKQINEITDYATNTGLQPDVYTLGAILPYELMPVQYSFKSMTLWSTSGITNLPYGSLGSQNDPSLVIWEFPTNLLTQIAKPKINGSAFDIQIGTYDSAKGTMEYKPSDYYGWSTQLTIDIKKIANNNAVGTSAFTYELIGADEAGTQILERLLLALDPNSSDNNQSFIDDMQWLYMGDNGLLSVGNINMKSYIIQSNLSTETNPDVADVSLLSFNTAVAVAPNGIMNSLYNFVKLLWECSITRSGGYYLLYNEIEGDTGFPDSIFDNSGIASIRLFTTYKEGSNPNVLKSYMNCAVTGDKIDTNSSIVYAESKAQTSLTYATKTTTETLTTIAEQYNILLSELAELNKTSVALTTTFDNPIILTGLVFEVGLSTATPSNNLTAIAAYYNVLADNIKELNKNITAWDNLDVWQLVIIPNVSYEIESPIGVQGNTFETIANYYFIDISTLSFLIKDNPLFASNTTFEIIDQIVQKISSVSQGSAGFDVTRKDPDVSGVLSPNDPGYADQYLNNLFNLLNYQVVENKFFSKSVVGLPSGPTSSNEDTETVNESTGTDLAIWQYNQVINVAQFALPVPEETDDALRPSAIDNAYRGIGNTLQVHFNWVDYYGNQTITPLSDPSLNASSPLNNPPIQVGYMDELKGLSQWPSTFITYDISGGKESPELLLNFIFNITRYENTNDEACIADINDTDNMGDWQKNALHDLTNYTTIYNQITQLNPENGENTVTFMLVSSLIPGVNTKLSATQYRKIKQYVQDVYQYLYTIAHCKKVPMAPGMEPISQPINDADITLDPIFMLTVNLNIERDLSFVNNDFKDSPSVTNADTIVEPNTQLIAGSKDNTDSVNTNENHSLTEFSENFENTFYTADQYVLKIATGVNEAVAGGKKSQAIYVVRMGFKEENGIYWSVYEAALSGNLNPSFYAPTPTSTSLQSKSNVPICPYTTGGGLDCSANNTKNYTGIDLDIWGKQCLEAIDQFLGSEYSVPAFLVDELKNADEKTYLNANNIEADSFLEAITNAKSSLANTISLTVEPILQNPVQSTGNLLNAQEKFKQQLLMKLGNTYSINAIVQMKATGESNMPKTNDNSIAPRLYGTPTVVEESEENLEEKLYSISNAKVQLNFEDAQNDSSEISFIFSTKNADTTKTVSLNMSFQITHVEFEIENVPNVEGYQASKWLTFIIPANLEDTAQESALVQQLGQVDIPIVLRNYPEPPTLTKQEAVAVTPMEGETTKKILEQSTEWGYDYNYNESQVAQDKIFSNISFNAALQASDISLFSVQRNLFNDMAQMIAVWPQVLSDLTTYLTKIKPSSDVNDPNVNPAYFAMQTLVETTNNLALAWEGYNGSGVQAKSMVETTNSYDFVIEQNNDLNFLAECDTCTDETPCGRLILTIVPPANISTFDLFLFNTNTLTDAVLPETPVVEISGYTRVEATELDGSIIPNSYWYSPDPTAKKPTYLAYACSFDIVERLIKVNGLNVLEYQDAWAGISIIRNEDLVDGNQTSSDFIYRTPLIRFSNKLIPLLNTDVAIDIAKLENESGVDTTLVNHLANLFNTLFFDDHLPQQTIKISASWNYKLIANAGDILPSIQLPILLYTPFSFEIPTDYTIEEGGCPVVVTETTPFVCQMAAAMELWYSENMPITTEAYFSFDLSIFSGLTETQLPILQLSNLVIPFKNINSI
ncbi:hypothetical protein CXF68_14150 [Tenacibaculum sp. Bg11-29]|uniref:LysM peptidoglycan-binding domain-containing protein n=1 Tax=Tenacibaculum sp. Bg11-29 TaxID=2058306 RepID=UPI000C337D25|nr:LysM peptidoglycan-binding domain-containing protein [Tenacibaculum sp. Bg11-29]PKH51755.1 hypothetical protein CXF68_14150 [Tenacibaculum sp. Bg11-29]